MRASDLFGPAIISLNYESPPPPHCSDSEFMLRFILDPYFVLMNT